MNSTVSFPFPNKYSIRQFVLSSVIAIGSFLFAASAAPELDNYGDFLNVKDEKTGFFHTEKIDSRWIHVTPKGHDSWGIGMSYLVKSWTQVKGVKSVERVALANNEA